MAQNDAATERVNGYELDVDYKDVVWSKQHADGRHTQVEIDARMSDNPITVLETRDLQEIGFGRVGNAETKTRAKEIARDWMRANPEGLNT